MSLGSKVHDSYTRFVHPEWHPSRADAAIALGSFIGVPLAVGLLLGYLATKDLKSSWFKALKKPKWTPPGSVAGPIWIVLLALLGFASWSVWTHGGAEKQKIPLGFYVATLLLNLGWAPLFFKARKLDLVLITAIAQFGLLTSTMVSFHSVEPLAALVLVPVWLAVGFIVLLSFTLFQLNPQKSKRALSGVLTRLEKLTNNTGE